MKQYVERERIKNPGILAIAILIVSACSYFLYKTADQPLELAIPVIAVVLVGISISVGLVCLTMTVVISNDSLVIHLFPFNFIRLKIDRTDIDTFHLKRLSRIDDEAMKRLNAEPLSLRKLSLRIFKGEYALWIRTKSGKQFLVGTRHPAKLIQSIWTII